MTKEEAIYKAKHLRKVHPNICIDAEDFWETVIAALEQEPCDDCVSREAVLDLCDSKDEEYKVRHLKEDVECLPPVTTAEKQESYEDCISREKTMQIVRKWFDRNAVPSDLKNEIEQLPPVQPKQTKSCYKMCDKWQRMGRWKPYDGSWYECSECGAVREAVGFFENYCPNCGAKMEVDE